MKQKFLIIFYLMISIVAFILTWQENITYMPFGVLEGIWYFIVDTQVNAASRSSFIDLGFFFLAASVWMVIEGKRLKIKFSWLYVVFGLTIGISVTFPLFLIAREMKLMRAHYAGGVAEH